MSFVYELSDEQGIDDIAVTIESYTYDYEGNRISKQVNEEEKVFYLNDTYGGAYTGCLRTFKEYR